jgi:DNA invertase Pin-like site-specific DNA recombinase
MIIGYIRESFNHRGFQPQLKALKESGCKIIYRDKPDPARNKSVLEQMIQQLQKDDTVIIWKMDHIGKSLKDLIRWMNLFKEIEVNFISIQDSIDTRTNKGKMFYKVFDVLSEFEREIKSEKNIDRPETSLKKRRIGGRPRGLSGDAFIKALKAKQLYENNEKPVEDIACSLGIGKTTLYRYLHYFNVLIEHKKETGLEKSYQNEDKGKIRKELFNKLIESKAFWSYPKVSYGTIPDEILIQKVIEELDINDIHKLFIIYNKNYIRKVWKNQMVAQDPYFRSLNILLAKLFFKIKKPEEYIHKVQKKFLNSVSEL